MSDLTDALDELQNIWAERSMPISTQLNPGLSEAEIRQRCTALGLTPPQEAIEWFGWHNGAAPDDRDILPECGDGTALETLESALQTLHIWSHVPDLDPWLPLVRDVGPQKVCVSLAGESPARIAKMDFIPEPELIAHTLTEVVQYWSRQFISGRWHWDGKDVIARDDDEGMYPGHYT